MKRFEKPLYCNDPYPVFLRHEFCFAGQTEKRILSAVQFGKTAISYFILTANWYYIHPDAERRNETAIASLLGQLPEITFIYAFYAFHQKSHKASQLGRVHFIVGQPRNEFESAVFFFE